MQEMSDIVIVTIPETTAEDLPSVVEEDKAVLVTAELTPEPGEEILTVAPVEEAEAEASGADSLSREEAVIVKLSEEVDVEADVFYPITCGDTRATLVWKKFVCPGINVKCVQEFVCLAGKSTLKDWKRAIRLNGTMLRKIMDSGELDFYQHTKVCSNTCRSTKIVLVGTKVSVSSDQSADLVPATPSSADLNGAAATFPEVMEETSEWVTAIGDAVLLNNIVQNFGMLDLVKKVLASHKSQMDRYREQYTRSLAALEQQCDEHRKRAKELKSKSQHLNNVLMTLTPVPAPPAPKRPRLTRAVSGPASVNAAPPTTQITLPLNQLSGLPLGKVLTVAGAPPGANHLGSYTFLTSSSLSGSELASDGANHLTVLSAAPAGQEGAAGGGSPTPAFVKVVGSQFQLVTLPAGLQSLAVAQCAVQQQVGGVGDATATAADDPQGDGRADADGEDASRTEPAAEGDGDQDQLEQQQ
ncbi:hypothetical protein FQN60_002161 [Etheostoma spectabile]|uniref:SAND domain-containing protein n=1 Tax=Etheostoma spectabile TaxID=54343 RepID=A0A5J5D934_9PERO|nr:hypothetical protein FQN60_002161 [Etheostoma spectabile]